MFGIHTGVVGHGGTAADIRIEGAERSFRDRLWNETLAGVFRTAGLKTALISPFAERHTTWSFYAGFTEMYNTGKGGIESAENVTPVALDWIERNAAEDDWFLHVNYWDPHTPYRAPSEFGNPFADDPLPEWMTPELLEAHCNLAGPHTAQDFGMYNNQENPDFPRQPGEIRGIKGFRRMIDGYDCGVRYMDGHIGNLLEALERKGVLDDLVIIVSADHGENLGELGLYGEHGTADLITCRIPMIVRWPGRSSAGTTDIGLRYNLDLVPTIADMLGVDYSDRWDGMSFASSLGGGSGAASRGGARTSSSGEPGGQTNGGTQTGHDYLVISQCAHVAQRGVVFDDSLYIRTYHDGFHPYFDEEMLFDLVNDPHETRNIAGSEPEKCARAASYLSSWHDRMMATMPFPDAVDPLWRVLHEKGPFHAWAENIKANDYLNRLRETGREEGLEKLLERHPELRDV